jgi:hypothetical protein
VDPKYTSIRRDVGLMWQHSLVARRMVAERELFPVASWPSGHPLGAGPWYGNPEFGGVIMDIVVWLRSLGLGKYEAAFRENEIDETVLPSLTHETLKELGVTAVGHRLKLLDATAALRNDGSLQPSSVRSENFNRNISRRHLSVDLFYDINPSAPPLKRRQRVPR